MKATSAPGKVIVSALLDEVDRDELLRLARAGDRSLSGEIRRGLRAYLQRETNHARHTPKETKP